MTFNKIVMAILVVPTMIALSAPAFAQQAKDPNNLVFLFDVADVAKARAWTVGEDLKQEMKNAGVLGAPIIHFVE